MIEGLQLSIPKRMGFIRIILTVSLLLSVLSSFNLWCGERTFPQMPLWNNFYLNLSGEIILLLLYCLLLVGSMFLRRHRLLLFLSIAVATVFVMADVNRLQAWFYFYNAMLLVFVFYNGRVDDSNKFTSYFIILQLIFASVYFFCGLNRFDSYFIESEFTATIAPLQHIFSERQFLFFVKTGQLIPFFLLFMGLGLIITPVRYLAFAFVMLFHVLLFFLLAPPFGNYNYPLWISNLSFILMAVFLFSGKTKQRYFSPSFLLKVPLFYTTVLFFIIFPFFTKTGAWPSYLTSNFKNDQNKSSLINLNSEEFANIPMYQKSFCIQVQNNYVLDYKLWCLHELNANCHNDSNIHKQIEKFVKQVNAKSSKNRELASHLQ